MIHIITHTFSRLLLLSILVVLNAVNAETIQLDINQFSESFSKKVNVSGSVRAGVMYSSSAEYVMPNSLYIDIGSKTDQLLCVKMLSVDGQYGADFTYKLTGKISGNTEFQLPTKLQNVVTSYAPNQLAVLAEIKPVCKKKGGYIVPASWGKPILDTVKVYLNSGVNTTFLKLYKIDGSSQKVLCTPVKNERNTAYDTECNIEDVSSYNLEETKILRKNYGNHSRPIELRIYVLTSSKV